jgi:hypothetical protein
MAFKLKSFSHPDVLKQFQPAILIRLLETSRLFFDMKGFAIPPPGTDDLDYLALAGILAEPDEDMPGDLVEALHLISELGTDEFFDDLLRIAAESDVEVTDEMTAPDLAARIWLKDPQLLERKDREGLFDRRKSFDSFRASDPQLAINADDLTSDFSALETELGSYFSDKKKGKGCRVIPRFAVAEVRFLVQHGQPCRREPSRKGAQSTCTFFRPEKTDVVVLDLTNRELRMNASGAPDLRKYRELFGQHLFGNPETFVYAEKYTLEPLRTHGEDSLRCRDVEGVDSVRVIQMDFDFGGAFESVVTERAHDVFKALSLRRANIPEEPVIRKAVFKVKLQGEKKPRTVSVKAGNKAGYQRGEESAIVENWLRARGFILLGTKAYAEAA